MSLNYNQYLGARRCCDLKVQGPQGPQGYQGPSAVGQRGVTGAQGAAGGGGGITGSQGSTGAQGPAGGGGGITGSQGATGAQGFIGATGNQGNTGAQGAIGNQGNTGSQGSTGTQGAIGVTGSSSPWIPMNGLGGSTGGYTGIGITGQDVLIYGNLLVTGGIDPTYLALTPKPSGPQGFINPLWVDSTKSNALISQKIYINNPTLNGVPLSVNNSTNAGILFTEYYNQRNATGGEFNRLSYYANGGVTGGTKIEYARIYQSSPVIASGSERGQLNLDVKDAGGMTTYISANGNTQQVSISKNLNMSSQNITNAPNITTPNSNPYGKTQVNYFGSASVSYPINTPDPNTRATLFNTGGLPTTLVPYTAGSFPSSTWGATTASTNFNGYTYVGTDNGLMYYSSDGVTWNQVIVQFNGVIRGMKEFNGYLYVVGDFTSDSNTATAYNGIAKIDTNGNIFQLNWANYSGNVGFNAKVKCIETASGYLYIGGDFTTTNGGALTLNYIAIVDSGDYIYCMDNSSGTGGGYGFNNSVLFIKENIQQPNVLIIGGSFTSVSTAFGGFTTNYNCIWTTTGSYDTNGASTPYQVVGMNARSVCATTNGTQVYVGGDFTGLTYGDYLVTFDWSGSNYIEAANPWGGASSPVNLILQDGGVFWTTTGANELFDQGVLQGISPTSSNWSAIIAGIWGQKLFSTISGSQNPFIGYIINNSQVITVSLVGGYSIQYGTTTYTGGITLNNIGSCVDMIYNASELKYYVASTTINAGFF